ncbi:MAG: GNAT family N-acetyltransferase [Vampirovibrionales bacterium]
MMTPVSTKLTFLPLDPENAVHVQAWKQLMQEYAMMPIVGRDTVFSEYELNQSLACLLELETASSFMGWNHQEEPIVLINTIVSLSTWNTKRRLNIHDLVVNSRYQGQGFSEQAFDFLKGYAQELGCTQLSLEVEAINHHALHVYKKQGFVGTCHFLTLTL